MGFWRQDWGWPSCGLPGCKFHRVLQQYWLISTIWLLPLSLIFRKLHTVWFYLYNILEKARLRDRKGSWQGIGGGGGILATKGIRGVLEWWSSSVSLCVNFTLGKVHLNFFLKSILNSSRYRYKLFEILLHFMKLAWTFSWKFYMLIGITITQRLAK